MKSFFSENRQKRTIGHSNCVLLYILGYLLDLSDLSSFDTRFPTSRSPSSFRNERDWSQGFPYLVVYLSLMGGTLWNHFSPLSCHQIQKLVDKKRGGQTYDPTPGNGDQFSAYGTAKLSGVPRESGHDPVQAVKANGVWTWQQFGIMLYPIVHTCGATSNNKKKIL